MEDPEINCMCALSSREVKAHTSIMLMEVERQQWAKLHWRMSGIMESIMAEMPFYLFERVCIHEVKERSFCLEGTEDSGKEVQKLGPGCGVIEENIRRIVGTP